MTTSVWIDAMGIAPTVVRATVVDERVLVDADVLETMAASVLDAEMLTGEDDQALADAIRETPHDPATGLHDVTELGGGWGGWAARVIDD